MAVAVLAVTVSGGVAGCPHRAVDPGGVGDGRVTPNKDTVLPQVSAGLNHTCAVWKGGTASCWGYNLYKRPNGAFVRVSVGAVHTCGLTTGGTVSCWGSSPFGQSNPPTEYRA